jgi:transposase InsO family protein
MNCAAANRTLRPKLSGIELQQSLAEPTASNQVWSADFNDGRAQHGAGVPALNIVDDYTREALAIEMDTPLAARGRTDFINLPRGQ